MNIPLATPMGPFVTTPSPECPDNPNGGWLGKHQWGFMMKALVRGEIGRGGGPTAETVYFCQWCLKEKRVPE